MSVEVRTSRMTTSLHCPLTGHLEHSHYAHRVRCRVRQAQAALAFHLRRPPHVHDRLLDQHFARIHRSEVLWDVPYRVWVVCWVHWPRGMVSTHRTVPLSLTGE